MAVMHSPFFDYFPTVDYDINTVGGSNTTNVPDIFFRIGFFQRIFDQTLAYDMYRLDPGDTPEIIAEKVYNDSGAGWIVLYANKIMDPQFDWPLDDNEFEAYIIGKYGSVANAQQAIHHAEKTLTIENTTEGTKHETVTQICIKRLTDQMPSNVPFDYWV